MLRIGYMTIEGAQSGLVFGPSVRPFAMESIEIVDIEHEVSHDVDPTHGIVSGDLHQTPLTVYKAVDCATPILYQMATTEEEVEVIIRYFVRSEGSDVEFFGWTLEGARITKVRQIAGRELGDDFEEKDDLLEAISFAYQNITWEHFAHVAQGNPEQLPAVMHQYSWAGTE